MGKPLRVALVGASGIGRHHARWWHLSGCQVVAFAGTPTSSVEATGARLRDYFGFGGHGFTDVGKMLASEGPVVDAAAALLNLDLQIHLLRVAERRD